MRERQARPPGNRRHADARCCLAAIPSRPCGLRPATKKPRGAGLFVMILMRPLPVAPTRDRYMRDSAFRHCRQRARRNTGRTCRHAMNSSRDRLPAGRHPTAARRPHPRRTASVLRKMYLHRSHEHAQGRRRQGRQGRQAPCMQPGKTFSFKPPFSRRLYRKHESINKKIDV